MSKRNQPVFEKPEQPDFLKQLLGEHSAQREAAERPMTDAPAQDDELPAIADEVDATDLDKIRELHGLPKADTEVSETTQILSQTESKPKSAQLAGLGKAKTSNQKTRKVLDALRAKRDAEEQSSEESSMKEKKVVKRSSASRKKIKFSADPEDA